MRPLLLIPLLSSLVLACSSSPEAAQSGSEIELLVAASDYSSSAVCGVPGACRSAVDLGKDPMLVTTNDRAFFVARDMDLVFELDPASGVPFSRFSVHVDDATIANPQDVAAAPDGSLFVALFNVPRIVVVKDGKIDEPSIDLSSFDPDGNPEAASIRIALVDGAAKAFVTLERLTWEPLTNQLLSRQPSQVLRIDVATRKVEAVIPLAGRNPFNLMSEADGALFMAEPGNFDEAAEQGAGIERFDIATSTTRLIVEEKDLAGSVAEVSVTSGCGAAIVAGPEHSVNPTSLITFDPLEGRPSAPVFGPTPGYDLQGLAWRGNLLYVGDRRVSGGAYVVHVLEREGASCTLRDTGRTIEVDQRPVALRPSR